ncbi:hypothetical protein OEZ85_006209 [Tetradesmus obliquus]|uniref:PB1 domain-containing protein n=2 Tax=Tetradesmus obliquus TaxID=3088 RepID=A0ABY8TVW3_TETOB|nr:hypothetical protein OEZ85_006209 [Tetradesmus obliquus]
MAKGKAKSPTSKPTEVAAAPKEALDLKNDGNRMFAQRDYAKAIQQYDAALKILPEGSTERADLLCNKAACFYAQNKLKEAVKECGGALEVSPGSIKALRHRAKALEKQGMFKAALGDIQAINKTESATDDSRETERRLRELVAGRRPSLANGGARAAGPAGSSAGARGGRSMQWPFSAKVTLGNETRLVQLSASAGYADLLGQVAAKFPSAGPVLLKYSDKDGDAVTITCRGDVQLALAEALKATDRRLGVIPPIRVTALPVDKSEVPPVPLEEQQEAAAAMLQQQKQLQQLQQLAAAQAAQQQQQAAAKQTAQTPSGEVIEIDDWLVEFANLFREMSGIDADRHIDAHNEGWTSTSRAMEAALRSEEAAPLFDKAIERFKEVTASGYLNWGNVFMCRGHKALDVAALAGQELSQELLDKVTAEFDAAEAKVNEALAVKPDLFDAISTMATLYFDRAKLAAKLLVKPLPSLPEGVAEGSKEAEAAAAAASAAATREALTKIKAADVEAAKAHMDTAHTWYKKAHEAAVALEQQRKAEADAKQKEEGGDAAAAAPKQPDAAANGAAGEPMALPAHAQVMYGNSLYEWSQVLAAVGGEWRGLLDEAVACFKDAGCAEPDIRTALKNHTQAEQLDLGPDPEPEQQPAAAAAAAAQQQQQHKPVPPEAKGLPKLERKPKEKAAAADK